MRRPTLVVIPAYNEADDIETVVRQTLIHADVCVVDDASTDDTAAIVGSIDGVNLIRHTQNTHIAGAILDGMRFAVDAGYDHCVTMDAGMSHDPDELPRLLADSDADLVIGSRVTHVNTPIYRRLLSLVGNALINLGLDQRRVPWGGAGLRDTTSGYRNYTRRAVELLLAAPMKSRSFDFHLEALAYVFRAGMRIQEVPITYRFSNSSLRLPIVREALSTVARLWREDFVTTPVSATKATA